MKILLVDDIVEDRRLLRYVVERQGHEVLEAENGREGYRVATSTRPDLIISDALMPVMDGFQFLRRVRADEMLKRICFIFYSATYKGDQDVKLAYSLGADGYIFKPIEPKAFWHQVESVLRIEGSVSAAAPLLIKEEEDYLNRYCEIVATKLAEKIREVEQAKARIEKSEALIRKILETVDEGFIIVGRDYRILSANRAFWMSAGMSEGAVVGQHCYEISHRCPRPCFEGNEECAIKQTFEDGLSHSVSHTHIHDDDSKCFVEIKSYPIFDEGGKVVSVIKTITDISERKKLEEQLRHAQKLEALGTMAGCVAHDFNNILLVIRGFGEMLAEDLAEDDLKKSYVSDILTAAERAAHLIQSLLIFSRKQQTAELQSININELVKGLKKMVRPLIGAEITIKINLFPQKILVRGDHGQLEQVMMNFVTNARDAMPDGGLLTIGTTEIAIDAEFINRHGFGKPGRYALITVSDTGAGMDEKTRAKIFEPFFTTKETGRGTGLGLAIVYGIVQQHLGYINCDSEKFRGTTMMVYLPLTKEERLGKNDTLP